MITEPFRQSGVQINQREQDFLTLARWIADVQGPEYNDPQFERFNLLPMVVCAVMRKLDISFKPEDNIDDIFDLLSPAYRQSFQAIVPQQSAGGVVSPDPLTNDDREIYLRAEQAVGAVAQKTELLKAALAAQLRDLHNFPGLSGIARSEIAAINKFSDPALDDEAVLEGVRDDFEAVIRAQFETAKQHLVFKKYTEVFLNPARSRVLNRHLDNLATSTKEESYRIYDKRPIDEPDLLRRMQEDSKALREAGLRDGSSDPSLS